MPILESAEAGRFTREARPAKFSPELLRPGRGLEFRLLINQA
jgi:hypothetical protein